MTAIETKKKKIHENYIFLNKIRLLLRIISFFTIFLRKIFFFRNFIFLNVLPHQPPLFSPIFSLSNFVVPIIFLCLLAPFFFVCLISSIMCLVLIVFCLIFKKKKKFLMLCTLSKIVCFFFNIFELY